MEIKQCLSNVFVLRLKVLVETLIFFAIDFCLFFTIHKEMEKTKNLTNLIKKKKEQ